MNVEWISSVAVIAADPTKSRELYALLHQAPSVSRTHPRNTL
jgi:hypothetical protein